MAAALESLPAGDRVRIVGGRNFDKFHGGMEGTIIQNSPDSRNMSIQFDDISTSGPEPMTVAYRHLEHAPNKGGYSAGRAPTPTGAYPSTKAPEAPKGPLLEEHGEWKSRQLVQLQGLQNAPELNGKLGRLQKFDTNAERWEVKVREGGIKRLKEDNLCKPTKPEVPSGLDVAELKNRGNECFKKVELEQALAYYSAALDLLEEGEPKPPEAEDPKYISVLYSNRAQCCITLCREVHGEEKAIGKEARNYAMKANIDSAAAIDLDPSNGKAYYRRGCAMLGMAASASRSKEAIYFLEIAIAGRASGGKDGVVLPNAMRHEVSNLLDYAKRRLDACIEAAVPDVEQCRANCKQQ